MSWIALTIGGVALAGLTNIADRFLVEKHIKNPITLAIVAALMTCAVGILFFAARGFSSRNFLPLRLFLPACGSLTNDQSGSF